MNSNRTFLCIASLIASLFLTGCTVDREQPASTQPENPAMDNGLITTVSPYTFEETGNRIRATLEERDLLIPADLNHQKNAAGVDLELRPTRVIIFGNPNLGTPLMQCSQSVAIDLPQKILIWEDESGTVQVAYNDPEYLKQRHGAEGCDEAYENVAGALNNLMEAALAE